MGLLQEYLQDPTTISKDLSKIQVSSLKDPYREIAFLFTRVIGRDFIATIPRLALNILHFTVHENAIFEWEK